MVTLTFMNGRPRGQIRNEYSFEVPEPKDDSEKRLYQFIIDTFAERKVGKLIPFTFENSSVMELARAMFFRGIGSSATLFDYTSDIYRFCEWSGSEPDRLVNECFDSEGTINRKGVLEKKRQVEEYLTFLKAKGLAPYTLCNAFKGVTALFRCNHVDMAFAFKLPKRSVNECRSPTVEELQRVLSVANIREKALVAVLAVSGLRIGTLARLRYGHVKYDLENGIVPVHLHIEAELTKGKYHSYDTFLNGEAAEFLQGYLNLRKNGMGVLPPERMSDDSLLFKVMGRVRKHESLPLGRISGLLRQLYFKSGLITREAGMRMYDLRSNSLRMFFRSQMAFLGVQRDIIEYMMGHKTDQYLDVRMNGIEYLREIYRVSGISITRQTEDDRVHLLKQMVQRLGFIAEDVFRPEFLDNRQKMK